MKTVMKRAFDPSTEQAYEIKFPAPEEVKKAILELEFPHEGITVGEAAITLADIFQLSGEQREAKNRVGYKTFRYDVVMPAFKELSDERRLEQPRGPHTPYVRTEIEPFTPNPDPQVSVSIEEIYQRLRKELTGDLIQIIRECLAPYEKRFDKIDARFDKIDARFEQLHEDILKLALTVERLSTEVEWMKRIVLGIGGGILLYIIKTIFFP